MKHGILFLGKAWSALKQDGLVRGMRRIVAGLSVFLPKRLEGDILIVASGVGASALYRGEHVAEELRNAGFRVAVTTQYQPHLDRFAETFSVFVFHRTLVDGSVATLFERAKKLGKTILYETDDLVFDPFYWHQAEAYQRMSTAEQKISASGVGAEILHDPLTTACTTTTEALAKRLRETGKPVFVVRNKLSKADVAFAEHVREHVASRSESDSIRIGYFSGGATHDRDFASITTPLLHIFEKYPRVKLVLAGPLECHADLKQFESRIERLPFTDRQGHFRNISSVDINLAPLIIGDPFCEGKSELKFFESGIFGIPTVAAATEAFRGAIRDGENGFLAGDERQWEEKLSKLIEDRSLRTNMGVSARETTLQRYTTQSGGSEEYYAFLREHLKK